MIRKILLVLFTLPLVAACSGPRDPDREIGTFWHTIPPSEFNAGEVTLQENDVLIRQEVRPASVAVLESDVVNDRGSVIAKSGMRLHASRVASGRTVYCLPRSTLELNILTTILTGDQRNALCLGDRDEDGRFEERQKVTHRMSTLPIVTGKLSSAKGIEPVPYSVEENGRLSEKYYLEIRYYGPPDIFFENNRNFSVYGGTEKEMESMPEYSTVNIGDFPKDITLIGARITVLEENENGLLIKFRSPMDSEFTMYWTTRTYVY